MGRMAGKTLIWFLVLGLMFGGLIGCSEDGDDDEDETAEAPQLPPDASMTMDFSAFGGDKMAPSDDPPGANFVNAAGRVIILNVAVIINLAPSVIVFKAASNTIPVQEDDGSWTWSYTAEYLIHTFEANLNGRMEGFGTLWSMRVSCDTLDVPIENFEWYTGEVKLNNSSGSWQFFDHKTPDAAKEIGTIEWEVEDKDTSNLIFSNTDPDSPDLGNTLTYSIDGTTAEISFYTASDDLTAKITWDTVTLAGSIMAPGYNNGERAYWDENLQDVEP